MGLGGVRLQTPRSWPMRHGRRPAARSTWTPLFLLPLPGRREIADEVPLPRWLLLEQMAPANEDVSCQSGGAAPDEIRQLNHVGVTGLAQKPHTPGLSAKRQTHQPNATVSDRNGGESKVISRTAGSEDMILLGLYMGATSFELMRKCQSTERHDRMRL